MGKRFMIESIDPCRRLRRAAAGLLALAFAAAVPLPGHATPPPPQQHFATAEAAAEALNRVLQSGDPVAMHAVLGAGSEKVISSGDKVADAAQRAKFLESYAAAHTLAAESDGKMVLSIGPNAWPLPIPIVKDGAGWFFDTAAAAQEIVDRRIGRNELLTIRTLLAAVAAQQDYFERVQAGTGTGAYAQRVASTPGMQDGLYWDAAEGEPQSPLAPLIDQAREDGYPGAVTAKGTQAAYHGYLFRLLLKQGAYAPGGAKPYVQDGKMTGGFAFIAWPAEYNNSGIYTFIADKDGVVFQKDLGEDTGKHAAAIHSFNPDTSWARIDIVD